MDREGDAYEVMMAVQDAGGQRHHPLCPEPPESTARWPRAHEAVRSQPVLDRGDRAGQTANRVFCPRSAVVQVRSMSVNLIARPGEISARLADDLESGRGVGARTSRRNRARPLAALDAGAGGNGSRSTGSSAEIHVPVADRGGAFGAQKAAAGWRICGWRPGTDWRRP